MRLSSACGDRCARRFRIVEIIAQFNAIGIDDATLAGQLQREGAASFVKSWNDLLDRITQKSSTVESQAEGQGART